MSRTSWCEELAKELKKNQDKVEFIVIETDEGPKSVTLDSKEMKKEFDGGFGCNDGASFTAWGSMYVYFPVNYDGAEWVGYVPRNPCLQSTGHQGGG